MCLSKLTISGLHRDELTLGKVVKWLKKFEIKAIFANSIVGRQLDAEKKYLKGNDAVSY